MTYYWAGILMSKLNYVHESMYTQMTESILPERAAKLSNTLGLKLYKE